MDISLRGHIGNCKHHPTLVVEGLGPGGCQSPALHGLLRKPAWSVYSCLEKKTVCVCVCTCMTVMNG